MMFHAIEAMLEEFEQGFLSEKALSDELQQLIDYNLDSMWLQEQGTAE